MNDLGIQGTTLRSFDDVTALRQGVYDRVRNAYANQAPIENKQFRLELSDVDYDQDEPTGYDRQKKAIIGGRTLHRSLSGNYRLVDKLTGETLDQRRSRIAMVPHVTSGRQ